MLRAALLLIVLSGFFGASAMVDAQPAPPAAVRSCNLAAASVALRSGAEPNFMGCLYRDAQKALAAFAYRSGFVSAKPQPGVSDGTIVRQRRVDRQFFFSVVNPPAAFKAPIDIVATPQPVPRARPVSFSIEDAQPVGEGAKIIFPIIRERLDGRTHRLKLRYSNAARLREPPAFIEIQPLDSSPTLTVETIATPSGDGDHRVTVGITSDDDSTRIGRSASATGLISDTQSLPPPLPPSTAYKVEPAGSATRGEPIRFLVTRTGALPAATIAFEANEGGLILAPLETDRVHFAEGAGRGEATVAGERYGPCSSTVGVTLKDVIGEQLSADWQFNEAAPEACNPQPSWRSFVPPGELSWIPPAIFVVGLFLAWWLWPAPDPAPTPDPGSDVGPGVQAIAEIESGSWSFDPPDDAMGRWPPIEGHIVIERGDAKMPDPLPSRTKTDG